MAMGRRSYRNLCSFVILAVIVALSATEVRSDASDHKYKLSDQVPLYANKVGPFHNPRYSSKIYFTFIDFFWFYLSFNFDVISMNFVLNLWLIALSIAFDCEFEAELVLKFIAFGSNILGAFERDLEFLMV